MVSTDPSPVVRRLRLEVSLAEGTRRRGERRRRGRNPLFDRDRGRRGSGRLSPFGPRSTPQSTLTLREVADQDRSPVLLPVARLPVREVSQHPYRASK